MEQLCDVIEKDKDGFKITGPLMHSAITESFEKRKGKILTESVRNLRGVRENKPIKKVEVESEIIPLPGTTSVYRNYQSAMNLKRLRR